MGRGLSELQRYIVASAAMRDRLYYRDILEGYLRGKSKRLAHQESDVGQHGAFFSRQRIGNLEYRRAMATLSRACQRLERRGLVRCVCGSWTHKPAVEITDIGRTWLTNGLGESPCIGS
jgi:hypothetical protein